MGADSAASVIAADREQVRQYSTALLAASAIAIVIVLSVASSIIDVMTDNYFVHDTCTDMLRRQPSSEVVESCHEVLKQRVRPDDTISSDVRWAGSGSAKELQITYRRVIRFGGGISLPWKFERRIPAPEE